MDTLKTESITKFLPKDIMDDQKDNSIIIEDRGVLIDQKGSIYGFINKKTEKLITALYMVTDCIDFDDALKIKLRSLGVELLSDMYKFSMFSVVDKHTHINTSISRTSEIISFVDIASTIGFISDMNAGILKREFNGLISELESHLPKKQQFSFVLNEEMFNIPRPLSEIKRTDYKGQTIGQSIGQDKGQKDNIDSLRPRATSPLSKGKANTGQSKAERAEKILFLIKVKGDPPAGEVGMSIKDISTAFTECSEKTIQRELSELIIKGQIKKTGDKRWSRYSLI